ncbi:MAG TPA: hypothetical protein PKM43_14515 [Verrucomicrobiota bacterium]|nr:hypothetical protein [Verrucomicrobiota bacterium]HRZ55881.1 hypothetical protein [Candidatus Paceibacterota bacterium]
MSIQTSVLAFVLFVLFVVSPDEDLDSGLGPLTSNEALARHWPPWRNVTASLTRG